MLISILAFVARDEVVAFVARLLEMRNAPGLLGAFLLGGEAVDDLASDLYESATPSLAAPFPAGTYSGRKRGCLVRVARFEDRLCPRLLRAAVRNLFEPVSPYHEERDTVKD